MADRLPMVGWYDPGQLARTAVEVLVSTMWRHADHRVLEALRRRCLPVRGSIRPQTG